MKVTTAQRYVENYVVTQTAAGERRFEPQLSNAEYGTTIRIGATVSADYKSVTLAIGPKVTRLIRMEKIPFVGDATGALSIQRPVLETQMLSTTLSLPDRGTVLLSSGEFAGDADGATTRPAPQQLLLLVKATVIEPDDTPRSP